VTALHICVKSSPAPSTEKLEAGIFYGSQIWRF